MDDSSPYNPFGTVTTLPYKDRSTGLIIFGVMTLLLGCVAGLLVPFMLFGQLVSASTTHVPTNYAAILPAVFIYAFLAVALIWLGIGSIQARRWARALLLIFSWSWLVMGVVMLIAVAIIMPKIFNNLPHPANQPQMPGAALAGAMIVMFLFMGFFFILLPAIWTFFFSSRHVKATCETRDPVTRWTDACPLPVLGLSVWLMFSVPMLVLMPIAGHGVAPFFGVFLTGWLGAIFYLLVAALWGYAASLMYQLKTKGWWIILVGIIVFVVSSMVTYARHDVLEMYQLMGYPQEQIDQIKRTGLLAGYEMAWISAFSFLPFLIYLLFVKKYFRTKL